MNRDELFEITKPTQKQHNMMILNKPRLEFQEFEDHGAVKMYVIGETPVAARFHHVGAIIKWSTHGATVMKTEDNQGEDEPEGIVAAYSTVLQVMLVEDEEGKTLIEGKKLLRVKYRLTSGDESGSETVLESFLPSTDHQVYNPEDGYFSGCYCCDGWLAWNKFIQAYVMVRLRKPDENMWGHRSHELVYLLPNKPSTEPAEEDNPEVWKVDASQAQMIVQTGIKEDTGEKLMRVGENAENWLNLHKERHFSFFKTPVGRPAWRKCMCAEAAETEEEEGEEVILDCELGAWCEGKEEMDEQGAVLMECKYKKTRRTAEEGATQLASTS